MYVVEMLLLCFFILGKAFIYKTDRILYRWKCHFFICNLTSKKSKDFLNVFSCLIYFNNLLSYVPLKIACVWFKDTIEYPGPVHVGEKVGHDKGQSHITSENGHVCPHCWCIVVVSNVSVRGSFVFNRIEYILLEK